MISLLIPTYEMHNRGVEMLSELIESIGKQTYRDLEVIVCDSSVDGSVSLWCEEARWRGSHFTWFPALISTPLGKKFNYLLNRAHGEIIKPMCQDDKFIYPDTLEKIATALETAQWAACGSHNTGEEGFEKWDHIPYVHRSLEKLREGENTYGGPSAMAWRKNDLRFDEELIWLLDCEFWARMAERYGPPAFVDSMVYVRQWSGQVTWSAGGERRVHELNAVRERYA